MHVPNLTIFNWLSNLCIIIDVLNNFSKQNTNGQSFLPLVGRFVEGSIVDGSIDKITEKYFIKLISKFAQWILIIIQGETHKIPDILPSVGGFVEGGMVDGAVDKITDSF